MRIAIIGAGNVGGALAAALGRKHDVALAVRDLSDPSAAALVARTGARLAHPAEAAAQSQIVILAVPWDAAIAAASSLGDLAGKIVVDATNPLRMGKGGLELALGFEDSGAERIARAIPAARVVKAFNQTGANNMDGARAFASRPVMFMAGDDSEAKQKVAQLIEDAGFMADDAGPLSTARLLEPLAALWISRAFGGRGRDFAFALVEAGNGEPAA